MKYCPHCAKDLPGKPGICPDCGTQTEESLCSVLCFLSALFPPFGILYWISKRKSSPLCAKACGITAVIAAVVYLLLIYLIRELAGATFILFLVSLPGG